MKLNGFHAFQRSNWKLLFAGLISREGFMLWVYYSGIADFDPSHGSKFGTFEFDRVSISKEFRASESSVYNWHNELKEKNIVKKINGTRYLLRNHERNLIDSKSNELNAWNLYKKEIDLSAIELSQLLGIISQPVTKKSQHTGKKAVNLAKRKSSKYISSSKVESSYKVRSIQECEQIAKEFNLLTADDILWIDKDLAKLKMIR